MEDEEDLIKERAMSGEFLAYLMANKKALTAAVGSDKLPRLLRSTRPLGCGFWGCVFQLKAPGVVLKVTLDASEGAFVAQAISLEEFPPGIVRYDTLIEDAAWKNELLWDMFAPPAERLRLYLLWREEAFFGPATDALRRGVTNDLRRYRIAALSLRAAIQRLDPWPEALGELAGKTNDFVLQPSPDRQLKTKELRHAAATRWALEDLLDLPPPTERSAAIWTTLGFYLRRGFLLVDLPFANLGVVKRNGKDLCVITDPGHSLPVWPLLARHAFASHTGP